MGNVLASYCIATTARWQYSKLTGDKGNPTTLAVLAARVQAPHADCLLQAQRRQRRADGGHGDYKDERHCSKNIRSLAAGLFPTYSPSMMQA